MPSRCQSGEVGVPASDGIDADLGATDCVQRVKILQEFWAMVNAKESQPSLKKVSRPSGKSRLIPEINDIDRSTRTKVFEGSLHCVLT